MKNLLSTCKYFFKYIYESKKIYFVYLVINTILVSLAPFLNIIVPKYIINELMGKQNIIILVKYVGILVIGNFLFAAGIKIITEQRKKMEDWFSREFDMLLSKKTMKMKYENTEKEAVIEAEKKAGTGMGWYTGGVRGLMDCVIAIIASAITLIGVVYIVFEVSIWLIAFSIVAVLVNAVTISKCNLAQQEVFKITPAINKFYYYIYQQISERKYAKEIRLYDASEVISKKALENAISLNRIDNACAWKQTRWGLIGGLVSTLSSGISYAWLGISVVRGDITVAGLVACVSALDVFANQCLIQIIKNVQDFGLKCNFMNSFVEYMDYEEDCKCEEKMQIESFENLEFSDVSFSYPGSNNMILEHVSFRVNKGERVSIVGLNGAGKTTIVKLICRLYTVNDGDIRINGKSIYLYEYESYIKLLAVVFQDFKLFGYTINQNILLGDVDKTLDGEKLYEMCGIANWVNQQEQKGNTLIGREFDNRGIEPSGGIAQKIAIARALHRDAPIVILDEPTSALDPVAEYDIYNRFNDLILNKTAFYISHRLSSCKFCDRIIVLDRKHIVEDGTHNQLMSQNGLYAKMYQTQAKWYVSD